MPRPALQRRSTISRIAGILALLAAMALLAWALLQGSSIVEQEPQAAERLDVDRKDRNCDDDAASASPAAHRFCSLEAATETARGDSVIVLHGGSYPQLKLEGEKRSDNLTFRPRRGERVRLRGLYINESSRVRVEGMRITAPVLVARSSHVQLVGNDVSPNGISVRAGSRDILIARNRIHDLDYLLNHFNGGYGVLLAGGGGGIRDVVVRDNHISGIPVDGIQVTSVENLLIEGNEITRVKKPPGSDAHSDPIQLLGGRRIIIRSNFIHDTNRGMFNTDVQVRDLTLANNLFVRIDNFGTLFHEVTGLKLINNTYWDTLYGVALRRNVFDATVRNNVFDHFEAGRGRLSYEDHNLIASGNSYGGNDLEGPPQFVDPDGLDYRLAPGSPGIDAGVAEGAPKLDREGRKRGSPPDLGAQESG